ncbi:MAG: hypothetical protein J6U98_06365 [Abditibacteriota bacterium]|nr:hypothetical protein [Abditibacteriota bacterium]
MIRFKNSDTLNWIDMTYASTPQRWTLKEGAPDYARKEYEELMEDIEALLGRPRVDENGNMVYEEVLL